MSTQTFGKYLVTKTLGRGGMAEVYLARDPLLERNVAIKVIHPHLATESDFGERFRREAKLVASLRHAHIVQLYDFDIQNDTPYMVMEFLDSGSLKIRLGTLRAQNTLRVMPLAECARILDAIASALDFAHARGAIHRDVKPANILFTANDDPVLADFGIAKIVGEAAQLSASGAVVGSPAYMSPEQAASKPVDARSDIYALGIVAYEMVTGRVPFQGESPTAVLMQHLNTAPPPPRQFNASVPDAVQAVILQSLAKNPAERFPRAGEFARAFTAALRGQAPEASAGLSSAGTFVEAPATSKDAGTLVEKPGTPEPAASPLSTMDRRVLSGAGRIAQMFAPLIGRDVPDVRQPQDRRSYLATILGIIGILIASLQFIVGFFDLITRPLVPLMSALPYVIIALFVASGALSIFLVARPRDRVIRQRAAMMLGAIILAGGAWGAWTMYDRLTPSGTFVIAIADFDGSQARSTIDFAQRIYRRMSDEAKNAGGAFEIQRTAEMYKSPDEARARAAERKASLVIWGRYDDAGVSTDVVQLQTATLTRESLSVPVVLQAAGLGGLALPELPKVGQVTRAVRVPETLVSFDLFGKNVPQQIDLIAMSGLGLAYYLNGDNDNAIALFDKSLAQGAASGEGSSGLETIRFHRAAVLFRQNRMADAATELEQTVKAKPDFFEAQYNLAIAYTETCNPARYDLALDKANTAARLRPSSAAAQRLLADLYNQVGKTDLALRALEGALKLAPNDATTYEMLASIQAALGQDAAAQSSRQKAIALREQAKQQATASVTALLALGDAYLSSGDADKAMAEFQQAEKIAPNDARVFRALASAYYNKKDLAAAEREYKRWVAAVPKGANARVLLGLLYSEQGNAPAAIEELQQAVQLAPCSTTAYRTLGSLYFNQNDMPKAIAAYQQAVKFNAQDADLLYVLGALQYDQKQYADAEKNLQAALALRPNFASARFALSAVYQEQQQYQKAVTEREQLVKLAPNEAYYHAALGFAYEKVARWDDAIAAYQKSLALQEDPNNRVYLGMVYNRLGKYDAAAVEFQKALAANPSDALASGGMAQARFGVASNELRRCNLNAALQAANAAVTLAPGEALYKDLLAALFEAQGRGDNAAKLYGELRALPASNALAHLFAGEFLLRSGKADDAAREFQALLATPNLPPLVASWTRYDLGDALYAQDKLADAEREYKLALIALPANALAQARVGDLALRRGDAANALAEYDRGIAALPAWTQQVGIESAAFVETGLHVRRALALTRLNRRAEATSAFDAAQTVAQKIVTSFPQWSRARFNLAFVFLARGDKAKADPEFAAAITCDQSLGAARALLEAELNKLK
ncbi:MAG: tetratricopeptide repeat protein [Chloroflexi bacterium]|nr:tetratricopeptide repeat protein [Chloroflexota bacterium]